MNLKENNMNAKELLDILAEIECSGVNLEELDVCCSYRVYDDSGIPILRHTYPDNVEFDLALKELELR